MVTEDVVLDAQSNWQCTARLVHVPAKGLCVIADEPIRAGAMIGVCDGPPIDHDTVHSITLGGERIDPSAPFRFISHSCNPNGVFRDRNRWLYAVDDIPAGHEITIDYLHTETVISAPFTCECGAARCRTLICTAASSLA